MINVNFKEDLKSQLQLLSNVIKFLKILYLQVKIK